MFVDSLDMGPAGNQSVSIRIDDKFLNCWPHLKTRIVGLAISWLVRDGYLFCTMAPRRTCGDHSDFPGQLINIHCLGTHCFYFVAVYEYEYYPLRCFLWG